MQWCLPLIMVALLTFWGLGPAHGQAHKKRTKEELRAFNEKITIERREAQFLHKTHKMLVEEGRHAGAAQIGLQIKMCKQRINNEIAAESGLSEAYMKYKRSQKKVHPFASMGADKKSRMDWEEERSAETIAAIRAKCDSFLRALASQAAAATPPPPTDTLHHWMDKIERYHTLHVDLYQHNLAISRSFEHIKTLKEKDTKAAFLAEQHAMLDARRDLESAMYREIDELHAELRGKLGADVTGAEPQAETLRVRAKDEL